jgi:hypothetical protein
MLYALIHHTAVAVGPRTWHRAFFASYLDAHAIPEAGMLPFRKEDRTVIQGTNWRVVPVDEQVVEVHPHTEQLAGPTLVVHLDKVVAVYSAAPVSLDAAKASMKAAVAKNRYKVEVGGMTQTVHGQEVRVFTDRQDRHTYFQAAALVGGGTIKWKFPLSGNVWLDVNKADLDGIVAGIMQHVQDAYSWEAAKVAEIDAAGDKAALEAIELRHPSQL